MANRKRKRDGRSTHLLWMNVDIEVPKGDFVKKTGAGRTDYVSPLPCPFNYGSINSHISADGEFLDAVVLGPRLETGTKVSIPVRKAVRFMDAGIVDDKLICSRNPLTRWDRFRVLAFFRFYAMCKKMLNTVRGISGETSCRGWIAATSAIAEARSVESGDRLSKCRTPR